MPQDRSVAATFIIPYRQHISPVGEALEPVPEAARDTGLLTALYRAMVLTRIFDEKAVALQRTGRLGTYASSLGQEAAGVGVAAAMRKEDVLIPSFREQGAMFWRGVTMQELLLYWGGDERGSDFKGPREDFPVCVPVGTQFPHAAGVALAMQMRGEARVAVAVGGDGATSKGDFYEALNIAGVWRLPAVFIINNNGWAISVPRKAQSAAETLAQKAIAAGVPGEQVDGNDVVAVYEATRNALQRARQNNGPTLIEAVTYRLSDHTTADDAARYRTSEEVSPQWKLEPLARLRAWLVALGAWDKSAEIELIGECRNTVDRAVNDYLGIKPPVATDMLDYLYARLPSALEDQRAELAAGGDRTEAGHG